MSVFKKFLRPAGFWLTIFLLSACAGQDIAKTGISLTGKEFREAAGERINWLDAELPLDVTGEMLVSAKILGLNDFHGNLNGRQIDGRPVGGAAVLAAYLQHEISEAGQRAIVVHAGDMVGASPPASRLMRDEPTIAFLNMLANEYCSKGDLMALKCNLVGTLGNHEFDDGPGEMQRLLFGGRHETAESSVEEWSGAMFPYVAANVVDAVTGETILPPYTIKDIDGVQVAFIGAVTINTPSLAGSSAVVGLRFLDEAISINSFVPAIVAKNVHAIVVTIHQGLGQYSFGDAAIVGRGELQGEIIDIVSALDDEIDIVISGHSHNFTNVLVPTASGKQILLTQAFSYGTAYSDIDIVLDRSSGDIVEMSAAIVTTWADQGPGLAPITGIASFVNQANLVVEPLVSRIVGTAATDITRDKSEAGETALGNLVADSFLAAMDADFAFAGLGGIREDIVQGDIDFGTLASMHPFGNKLVALTLTGEQITRLLLQQWAGREYVNMLQIAGLKYSWRNTRPDHDKLLRVTSADGTPLDQNKYYRVVVPSFHAGGGDGFSVLLEGTDRMAGPLILDAFATYIEGSPHAIEAKIEGRISLVD